MKTKNEMKIISQIIQELSLFLMFHGYQDYRISFKKTDEKETFTISLKEKNNHMLKIMEEKINREREQEIEAYYWELLGDMDSTSELEIMGLLIDSFTVKELENGIEIELIRKR